MMKVFTRAMAKSTKKSAVRANVERDCAIAADRRSGLTFTALESKYGLTRERCRQICDDAGVPKTGRGRPPFQPSDASSASPAQTDEKGRPVTYWGGRPDNGRGST